LPTKEGVDIQQLSKAFYARANEDAGPKFSRVINNSMLRIIISDSKSADSSEYFTTKKINNLTVILNLWKLTVK